MTFPEWIKSVSAKWSEKEEGITSDEDFANAMRYMLIMFLTAPTQDKIAGDDTENNIQDKDNDDDDDDDKKTVFFPSWLKEMASSWSHGEIDNTTWKNMIQYLYEKEIIVI